jgi:hypothetical protein
VRCVGCGKNIPAFAAKTLRGHASFFQSEQSQGYWVADFSRAATSRVGLETTLTHMVQHGFSQNTSGRVVGAQKKNVQGIHTHDFKDSRATYPAFGLFECKQVLNTYGACLQFNPVHFIDEKQFRLLNSWWFHPRV